MARLEAYAALLQRWQRAINLVSNQSLSDLWRRHMLDSAQLLQHAPGSDGIWLDLGSGAGFPGLVLAIMGVGDMRIVERDARKCAFLSEAARVTGTEVIVLNRPIAEVDPVAADVITARALAPLPRLLGMAVPFIARKTVLLLPKGRNVGIELTEAAKCWKMRVEQSASLTDPSGTILRLREVSRDKL